PAAPIASYHSSASRLLLTGRVRTGILRRNDDAREQLVVDARARTGPLAAPRHPPSPKPFADPAEGFFVARMTDDRIIRTLPADLLTPVGAYLLLHEALGAPAFLLESVERGE